MKHVLIALIQCAILAAIVGAPVFLFLWSMKP
jgi:nitrogen fixation-related uncharacterized protein